MQELITLATALMNRLKGQANTEYDGPVTWMADYAEDLRKAIAKAKAEMKDKRR